MLAVAFLFPMILAAGGAAAAPVVIHLLLRTKPRKIIFPAMRFVLKTHQANLSKQRLKHLILLAMRVAAIAVLAALIARTHLPAWTTVAAADAPAAVVVVVDNSASMGYVYRGKSLLERGKQLALGVVDALPSGSRSAVLASESPAERTGFQAERKFVAEQIASVPVTCGERPLSAAIARALALLSKADLPRRELIVVTDMTARAWRDMATLPRGDVRVVILQCGSGEDANISLGEAELDGASVPLGAEVCLDTAVRSAQVGGEVDVRAELDGEVVDSRAAELAPGSTVGVSLAFRPKRLGVVHGRVFFQQDDPLAMDNVRYFTLRVGPAARVLLVRDPATVGRGDPTGFLLGHAIAPASAGAGAWIVRQSITAERLDAAALGSARIVLLGDVSALSAAQWRLVERFVRDGGNLWVVIGSLVAPDAYNTPEARAVIPAALGEPELLGTRMAWQAPGGSEPVLQPFTSGDNPPLSDVRCDRRLRISAVAPEAHVTLRYADNVPAIVTRRLGGGTVVLWNFSPVRGFSNLAGLPQFPILAQRTARLLGGGLGEQMDYVWGQTAAVEAPRDMAGALATVRRPGSLVDEPLARAANQRVVSIPVDRLGGWTVQFADGPARTARGFSVNVDPAESDLAREDPARLRRLMRDENLLIATDVKDLAEHQRMVSEPLDLSPWLLMALLALLLGESFFANRFYRRDTTTPGRDAVDAVDKREE